jgi:ABC-type multidrug transport system ATPase subunit
VFSDKIQLALGIDKIWLKRINALSGGQKRAVSLGLAFIKNPKFMLLDEPTSSLDIDVRNQFWQAVVDYKKTYNLTLLIATHNMWEVERFVDNVLVIKAGKLQCELDKDEFSNLVNGHVITIVVPKIQDLQDRMHSEISRKFQNLELLHSDENNIKYINNQAYSIDDLFNGLKSIVLDESKSPTKIAVNLASIDDCYYYALDKMDKKNVKVCSDIR